MTKILKATVAGYLILNKNELPFQLWADIRSKLTWDNPEFKDAQFRGKPNRWQGEDGKWYEIPRYLYGFHTEGSRVYISREFWPEFDQLAGSYELTVDYSDKRVYQKPRPLPHNIKLWKSQLAATRAMMNEEFGHQGILKAPCGGGKTTIMLYLAAMLGQRTLILAHTNDLIVQWQQQCEKFLDFKPGLIQGDTVDIKRITIGSVMTLAARELTPEFLNKWGMVILDEAHHCPAESFKSIMTQFPAYFRFGATATPGRSDKLEGLLFSVCGDIIAEITYEELEKEGKIIRPEVVLQETGFKYPYSNMHQWPRMIKAIKGNGKRNRLIASRIVHEARSGRKVQLVLSNHIDHLVALKDEVEQLAPKLKTSMLVAGGKELGVNMTKAERLAVIERARKGKVRVLFGTQLADEGLDLPILSGVHLTFPTRAERKVIQQLGRTARVYDGKDSAVVYDYVDNVSLLRNQSSDRRGVYQELGLKITRRTL